MVWVVRRVTELRERGEVAGCTVHCSHKPELRVAATQLRHSPTPPPTIHRHQHTGDWRSVAERERREKREREKRSTENINEAKCNARSCRESMKKRQGACKEREQREGVRA